MRSETADSTVGRAVASRGSSSPAIYEMVARVVARRHAGGGTLVDVGCGSGELWEYLKGYVDRYIGADVVKYDGFPQEGSFSAIDLDSGTVPLADASASIVAAIETIEHLENPRAFFRELHRLAKPGGLILVSTPNQGSLLSLLTLATKGVFNAFQEAPGLYPSHITALLEVDLRRMGLECGMQDIAIDYSESGRIPFTAKHWPGCRWLGGRWFSDNLVLSARVATAAR